MRRLMKVLRFLGLGLVVLILVMAVGGFWFVRRPWPQVDGQITAAGLTAPVQVIRDTWGVPHIYAENDHDLFFGQGYVHAQDRLWQMDFNRRVGSGRLSEALGAATIDNDRYIRTVGWRRAAQKDWELLDEDTRAVLNAYSEGVNAYIESHRNRLPLEFTILGITPEPWTPIDTLSWGKTITFDLGGNHRLELLRAQMIADLGEEVAQQLLPPYGGEMPLVIPPEVQGYDSFKGQRFAKLDTLDKLMGEPGPVTGSNNWVVHGSRTATGKPLLANDTHLNLGKPAIWYENGLHGGRFNSVGFTFPGVPAILIGHNERIAWGVSNVNPDVQDLYIEKLNNRENPTQYEFEGQWQDLEIITETIQVKNQEPVALPVYITRHGPIITDVIGEALPAPTDPVAFRWTALDGSTQFQAILQLNQARNWDEFRQALSIWDVPSQHFVYADVDGNIGYQTPGRIPIRAAEHQGLVPAPGWSGDYEWQGFVPFEELPHALNPSTGFFATANNKIVGDDYPYSLGYEWDPGYRAKRITDLLAADTSVTIDDMRMIQADTYSLAAEALVPHLLTVQPEPGLQTQALEQVRAWDKYYEIDRAGGSVFQVWYWFLLRNTLSDDMSKDMSDFYLLGNYERHGTFQLPFMVDLIDQPDDPWFDDKTTAEVENRDAIMRRSLADTVAWLSERYGNDPAEWTWGRVHTLKFVASVIGNSGIAPVEWSFNSATIPARGDNFTVNAGSFRYGNPFRMVHGASLRDIIDLDDFDNSRMTQSVGQSGHVFHPHNEDFIERWQNVEYHPMLFSREQIEANAASTLTLSPP